MRTRQPRRDSKGRRICARCPALCVSGSYCLDCKRYVAAESRMRKRAGVVRPFTKGDAEGASKPPTPPSGFDPRDLVTCRPYR